MNDSLVDKGPLRATKKAFEGGGPIRPLTPVRPYPLQAYQHCQWVADTWFVKFFHVVAEELTNIDRISFVEQFDSNGQSITNRRSELHYRGPNDTGMSASGGWGQPYGGGETWVVADYGPWPPVYEKFDRYPNLKAEVWYWDIRTGGSRMWPSSWHCLLLSPDKTALDGIDLPFIRDIDDPHYPWAS